MKKSIMLMIAMAPAFSVAASFKCETTRAICTDPGSKVLHSYRVEGSLAQGHSNLEYFSLKDVKLTDTATSETTGNMLISTPHFYELLTPIDSDDNIWASNVDQISYVVGNSADVAGTSNWSTKTVLTISNGLFTEDNAIEFEGFLHHPKSSQTRLKCSFIP